MNNKLKYILTANSTIDNILLFVDCLAIIILGYSQFSLKLIEAIAYVLLGVSVLLSAKTNGLSLKKLFNADEELPKWRIFSEVYVLVALFVIPDDNPIIRHLVADITIVLLFGAIIYAYIYMSKQQLDQKESIASLTTEMNSIIDKKHAEDQKIINDIFRRQFSTIDRLAAIRYEAADEKTLSKNYAREAARMVRELEPNSSEMARLKQYIDSTRGNLITRFEAAFPDLSGYYYPLFLYTAIGLSPRAMSVLFDLPVETIYNRKSRLKNIISAADTPDRADFLAAFE